VHVRPGTADVWAIGDTLLPPVHLPPEELCQDRPLRAVLDLGANIGLSMAHIAVLHPGARIVGVELDRDNARMAALNVASWDDRCEVLHGAAWHEDGTVQYSRQLGREMALAAAADEGDESAPAFSVAKLIERAAVDGRVDYMKMDIEGAEADVLRHGEAWAHRVRGISVEVHEPYTLDDCQSALESLGFQTRSDHRGTDATGGKPVVVGIRPPA
jgi:FkbM family methyltransferase